MGSESSQACCTSGLSASGIASGISSASGSCQSEESDAGRSLSFVIVIGYPVHLLLTPALGGSPTIGAQHQSCARTGIPARPTPTDRTPSIGQRSGLRQDQRRWASTNGVVQGGPSATRRTGAWESSLPTRTRADDRVP
jgi:hypothetical protein